jgi:hypothetical protein
MKLRTFEAANSTALSMTPGTIAELCGEPMKSMFWIFPSLPWM